MVLLQAFGTIWGQIMTKKTHIWVRPEELGRWPKWNKISLTFVNILMTPCPPGHHPQTLWIGVILTGKMTFWSAKFLTKIVLTIEIFRCYKHPKFCQDYPIRKVLYTSVQETKQAQALSLSAIDEAKTVSMVLLYYKVREDSSWKAQKNQLKFKQSQIERSNWDYGWLVPEY